MRFAGLCALLLGGLLFAAVVGAHELEDRHDLEWKVAGHFYKGEYETLERMAEDYRSRKARSSSGVWLLTTYYFAFHRILGTGYKDERFWARASEATVTWVKQYPRSPTAHIVRAIQLRQYGWMVRGGGYANTVPPEAWPVYRERVAIARQYLLDHKAIAASDPHWYEVMAKIATEEQWEPKAFQALVDEGLDREPLYLQLYITAASYHMPKWGGNPAEIEKFADAAVERTRASEGQALYARIYWAVSQDPCCQEALLFTNVVWDKMKRGIQDVLARHPDQWNINNFAYFACLARDRDETRRLLGMIQPAPILQGWKNSPELFQRCSAWAKEEKAA